jgi:ubiquinone biosynthesis protein
MFPALRHSLRLLAMARILARHGVRLPPGQGALLSKALGLFARRDTARMRPGERLAAALFELGPSFIKLGQALSVRSDLIGEELALDLGKLRDRLPPFPAAAARAAIEAELGQPVESLFQDFDNRPVAAASIAQVHFAVTAEGREVAVKVLRPGVEAAFRRDLELLFWLAGWAESLLPRWRRLRPVKVVETLAQSVAQEMDLRLEAAAAVELAGNFKGDPDFRVPEVDWQRTGRRVLTLSRVHGIPIDDLEALKAAGHDLHKLAERILRVFLNQALRDGMFHADLHQGNLFVAPDGAIEAVDFGIIGRLDRPTRQFMAEMLLAFLSGDYRRAAEVHFAAGYVPESRSVEAFAQALRSVGEPILGHPVNKISIGRLLAHLFQVTETFAMQTQPQLLLLQKTMVVAEGVARELDPEINFWTASRPVIEKWMGENLNPEARLRDAATNLGEVMQGLPALLSSVRQAAGLIGDSGIRLDAEGLRLLADAQASGRRPLTLAAWLIAATLAALLLLRAL